MPMQSYKELKFRYIQILEVSFYRLLPSQLWSPSAPPNIFPAQTTLVAFFALEPVICSNFLFTLQVKSS